jgi:predicted carbohydrate-binding protein with CBM5 and CBM33 domain
MRASLRNAVKMALPVAALTQAVLMAMAPTSANAHGSLIDPPSREYACNKFDTPWSNPKHSGCGKIASQSSSWMSNAVGGVLDNHQDYIPDGLLCAGGKEDWKEVDGNYDWPTTVLTPGADGKLTFKYEQTAPHITKYFRTYISKDSYDPKVGLRWSDLELIGDSGWMDRPVDDKISKLDVKIPAQYTGKRVIYTVWQRDPSDAKEGFYSCSNVDVMPVDMQWKASGTLEGGQVETGSTMTLRVFDKVRGGDLESHSIIVSKGQEKPEQWQYVLSQKTNNASGIVRLGKLGADGKVVPQPVANGNEVYGLNKVYSFAVDQRGPEPVDPPTGIVPPTAKLTGPATAEGGATVLLSGKSSNNGGGKLTYLWKLPAGITAPVNQADLSFVAPKLSQDKAYTFGLTVTNEKGSSSAEHTVTVKKQDQGGGGTGGGKYPAYKEGTAYKAGERVSNAGQDFECKPWPYTNWCGHSAQYYAPGTGLNWSEAWTAVK